MHCHICDRQLSETEIQLTPDGKGFEPCTSCMEIIMDAAYSGEFTRDEDNEIVLDDVPILDPEVFQTGIFDLDRMPMSDRFQHYE